MMSKRPIFSLVILLIACWAASEARAATYTLTVTADHGSVRVDPDKAQYDEGETVELIPRPDVGYSFSHWSGDLRGRRLVGRVTMDSNKSIAASFGMWTQPIGIPMPEFGIFETYRMYDDPANRNPELTYHQNAEGGYYTHYVDNTDPNATDSGNTYGGVSKPRWTIPDNLPAGSVVEVHGGPYTHTWRWFTGLGTFALPIFVRGPDSVNRTVVQNTAMRLGGSYLVLENFELDNSVIHTHSEYEPLIFHHLALRNLEIHGRTASGGSGISTGGSTAYETTDIVIYGNHIHHNGIVATGGSTDVHGVTVTDNSARVWIVDNHVHHNDGDSLQLNGCGGGCCEDDEWPKYVYVGRNVMHGDRENAIDLKDSEHVVISQNEMFGYTTADRVFGADPNVRAVHGSDGTAVLPGNEGGRRTWVLFNEIYDSRNAIRIDDECVVANSYILGNAIHDISEYGLITWRTMNIHLANNTFYNVGIGFYSSDGASTSGSTYTFDGNIFAKMNGFETENRGWNACYVRIGVRADAENVVLRNNLFSEGGGFEWGRYNPYETLAQLTLDEPRNCEQCLELNPAFVDASGGDYRLDARSPVIDMANQLSLYEMFSELYGIDIRKDIAGRARPQGGGWDIGAYEYVLEPVENLAGSGASRNSVALNWTIPGEDGSSDRPGRYDIRYAQSPLTEANWDAATQVQGEPAPADVGDSQSFTLTGLDSGTMYYIGIKTSNTAASTISGLSNVVSMATAAGGNHAPILTPIGEKAVAQNTTLTFTASASDADGDALTYSASGLPSGAAFNTATRAFSWTPTNTQSGVYWVTFGVTDGQVAVSETVEITVAEIVNNAPVLAAIGNKSVSENALLSFSVSATDADGHSLTYSATGLPSGANFTGQTFTWVPTYDQSGSYTVTFTVSDGELMDSEQITIAVANVTPDLADPTAAANYPVADAIQVPVNPVIGLTVSDAGGGVDANMVTIRVNDQLVYSGNTASHQTAYGVCRRTGTQASYRYYYQPAEPFRFDEQVSVRVTASDLAGNAMTPYTYSFTTEMRVFGDNRPASWAPDNLDKSRPATVRDSAGNIWLTYHAGPAGQRNIYLSKLAPGGDSFGGPVQLTANGSDQCYPAIGIGADDRLYVVWQDYRRGNWDIYLRTSADGVTWSAETRITDSDDHQTAAAIAVDGQSPNRVHVAWQDDGAGNQDIQIATSSNLFATKTISQVTTNASDQTAPAIAVNASNAVFLVWTDTRNGTSDVYGAASNSGPWTNVPIATGAGSQSSPAIAAEATGTGLHFAWEDSASGDSDVRYASSNGMPGSPLAGVNVADDTSGADQTAPTIAAVGSAGDGLRVFVCWVDDRNVNVDGRDTDLYFVEVSAGQGTNILVGDGGTGSDQSEPVLGVDVYGYPYVLWTDHRNVTKYVYYAGSTFMAPNLVASEAVTASAGGTVGVASPVSEGDASVVIPAAACPHDVTITISRILNPQSILSSNVVAFDFGPSGIQFSQPVTLTIPYAAADYSGGTPVPCWYVSQTGTLSQEGISNIQVLDLSSTLKALRFRTTHFTPYYLLESYVDDGGGDGDDGDGSWDGDGSSGGGGGGGGCSVSPGSGGDVFGYLVPYMGLAAAMIALRVRDRRAARRRGWKHDR